MGQSSNGLPEELLRRIDVARQAQGADGFEWARLSHLRFLDVPGMRYVPNLGYVQGRKAARGGWFRWVAVPFIVMPVLLGRDVWVGLDPTWLKVLYSAGLSLVVLFGGFLFWGLGPNRAIKVGKARHGLYFTPNSFSLWTIGDDGKDHILFLSREQVLRFFEQGGAGGGAVGTHGPSLWLEFRRRNGEVTTRRTGLPGVGSRDHDWLEHWRTTGALPVPVDEQAG